MENQEGNHLNQLCDIHNLQRTKVCVEKSCCLYVMCQKCVDTHVAEKNSHKICIKNFSDLITVEKVYKQVESLEKDKFSHDYMVYRAQHIVEQLKTLIQSIKKSFIEQIEEAEKRILSQIQEFCCLKNIYEPEIWNNLLDEYDDKLKYFLHSPPGIFTKEYVDFITVFKEINEKLNSIEYMRAVMSKIKIEDLGTYLVSLELQTRSIAKDILDLGNANIRPMNPIPIKDIELGQVVSTNHSYMISAYAYLDDFNWIVTGNQKGAITFWDADGFVMLSSEVIHRGEISNILYIREKNLIVSASKSSVIKVIGIKFKELEVRNPVVLPEAHKGVITCLCYLDGLNKFASFGEDTLINIWDLETNEFDFNIETERWSPSGYNMAYVKKHKLLVIPGKKSFRIYNAKNGELCYSETLNCAPNTLEYLEKSSRIITQKDTTRIGVWQIRDDVSIVYERDIILTKKCMGFVKAIEGLDLLFFTSDSGFLLIYKLSTGVCERQFELQLKKPSCIIPFVDMRRVVIGDAASENMQYVLL